MPLRLYREGFLSEPVLGAQRSLGTAKLKGLLPFPFPFREGDGAVEKHVVDDESVQIVRLLDEQGFFEGLLHVPQATTPHY